MNMSQCGGILRIVVTLPGMPAASVNLAYISCQDDHHVASLCRHTQLQCLLL